MPRAEVGSTRYIANKMKQKGLQRLRWYCEVCQKQCRDSNGFKQHCLSEGHVRAMQLVGEDPKKYINQYSEEFKSNFVNLLRTGHGEKKINSNVFYNTVIQDKQHTHMNATKWKSLTEFVKYLGREGIVRVEEGERGLDIAYIDSSPETLRRQDAMRKKERLEKGEEEMEQKLLQAQIERAHAAQNEQKEQADEESKMLHDNEGEKVKLTFGSKLGPAKPLSPPDSQGVESNKDAESSHLSEEKPQDPTPPAENATAPEPAVKMSFGVTKPKNVFSAHKKNPLAGKKAVVQQPARKMTEMERIMKEEMEMAAKKRRAEDVGFDAKRRRFD
ncbi:MAG: hypothetical protein M1820_000191 [Bogoriella megaspora]|nr:MAG: hypothetical protein M1820_000191 [Bogoriella megaspora]